MSYLVVNSKDIFFRDEAQIIWIAHRFTLISLSFWEWVRLVSDPIMKSVMIVLVEIFDLIQNCLYLEVITNDPFEPRHDKSSEMSVRPAKTQISLGIRPV